MNGDHAGVLILSFCSCKRFDFSLLNDCAFFNLIVRGPQTTPLGGYRMGGGDADGCCGYPVGPQRGHWSSRISILLPGAPGRASILPSSTPTDLRVNGYKQRTCDRCWQGNLSLSNHQCACVEQVNFFPFLVVLKMYGHVNVVFFRING